VDVDVELRFDVCCYWIGSVCVHVCALRRISMIYDVHTQYFQTFLSQSGVQSGADPVARIAALKNSGNKVEDSMDTAS